MARFPRCRRRNSSKKPCVSLSPHNENTTSSSTSLHAAMTKLTITTMEASTRLSMKASMFLSAQASTTPTTDPSITFTTDPSITFITDPSITCTSNASITSTTDLPAMPTTDSSITSATELSVMTTTDSSITYTTDPSTTPTSQPDPPPQTGPLLTLPTEILDLILQHTLTHPHPLPVSPNWRPIPPTAPSPLNYSILHASRGLYHLGIGTYYALNTWALELSDFRDAPTTYGKISTPNESSKQNGSAEPEVLWTTRANRPIAAQDVRTVVLTAREYANWEDAVHALKGFERLEKVVFDTRIDGPGEVCWDITTPRRKEADESPPRAWGTRAWNRAKAFEKWNWEVVPGSAELGQVLREAGVDVGDGGVWVGDYNVEEAERKMGLFLVEKVAKGAGLVGYVGGRGRGASETGW